MQIEVRINQSESIRRGVDAPHSTTKLEIHPGDLEQKHRDYIATYLKDGYKLQSDYGDIEYPKPLNEPTLAGLKEMIDERLAAIAEKERKESEIAEREARQAEAYFHRLVTEGCEGRVVTNRETPTTVNDFFFTRDAESPAPVHDISDAPEHVQALARRYCAQVIADKQAEKLRKDAEAEQKHQEEAAKAEAEWQRIRVHLSATEHRLEARGRLNRGAATRRLEEAEFQRILDEMHRTNVPSPKGYDGERRVLRGHERYGALQYWTPDQLETAEGIEAITAHPVSGIFTDCITFNTHFTMPWAAGEEDAVAIRVEFHAPESDEDEE